MAQKNHLPLVDPEDMFAETRMSFGDHIEDLRTHLVRALVGFLVCMVACILPPIGPMAVKFITAPLEEQLVIYYKRYSEKQFAKHGAALIRDSQPVPMPLHIHLPSLKKALEGKLPDIAENGKIMTGVDNLLASVDIDLRGGARDDASEWAIIPTKMADPVVLSKAMSDIMRIVEPKLLSTMSVQEAFTVYFKVGLLVGFVMSSPWVFYQVWSFIAAGLYPQEKRLVNYYLPLSLALFLVGFFVCEFLALPKAIEALLWFNEWLGFQPDLRLNEWLTFAILMPLVFGLSFQTPIVMLFFFKIGIVDVETFRSKRRIAIFLMAIFAAVITPSTDIANMMLLWVPMCLLYEVGIWLCLMQPKSPADEMDESELDEMVGV